MKIKLLIMLAMAATGTGCVAHFQPHDTVRVHVQAPRPTVVVTHTPPIVRQVHIHHPPRVVVRHGHRHHTSRVVVRHGHRHRHTVRNTRSNHRVRSHTRRNNNRRHHRRSRR